MIDINRSYFVILFHFRLFVQNPSSPWVSPATRPMAAGMGSRPLRPWIWLGGIEKDITLSRQKAEQESRTTFCLLTDSHQLSTWMLYSLDRVNFALFHWLELTLSPLFQSLRSGTQRVLSSDIQLLHISIQHLFSLPPSDRHRDRKQIWTSSLEAGIKSMCNTAHNTRCRHLSKNKGLPLVLL